MIHWFSVELNTIPYGLEGNSWSGFCRLFLPYFLLLFSSLTRLQPYVPSYYSSTMPSPFSPQDFTCAVSLASTDFPTRYLYWWLLCFYLWNLSSNIISLDKVFFPIFAFKVAPHHFSFTFSTAIIDIWNYIYFLHLLSNCLFSSTMTQAHIDQELCLIHHSSPMIDTSKTINQNLFTRSK